MKKITLFTLATLALYAIGYSQGVHADTKVYFPTGSANTVTIIDASNDNIVDTIPGVMNAHGLAAVPGGDYLVVGSLTEKSAGERPTKPSEMPEQEHRAHHAEPDADAMQGDNKGILYLVDIKERRVVHQFEVPGAIHHVAVTPDGRYAVSTHPGLNGVSVVDIENRKFQQMIVTGPIPNYALVTNDGKHIYISNAGNNTVSDIDPKTWIVTRNMVAGKTPEHMVLSPDEDTLYVANVVADTVSVLDLSQGKVIKTFQIGPEVHGIDLSGDGGVLFASSKDGNKLVSIDLKNDETKTLNLTPAPYHLAVLPGTGKLYVSSREKPMLWIVDQKSMTVEGEINIQGEGHQMTVVVDED